MTDYFSPDYRTARDRFRSGVLAAGGQIESILLDAKGPARSDKERPSEEDLTIDIGWFGARRPRRAFVHSCGLHGVEGFAGSAIQLQWLEEGIIPEPGPDCAIVLVHVMNPFGMAWLRRVNENNVDLNRNFLGVDQEDGDQQYAGAPEHYAALNALLNPESPPAHDFFLPRAAWTALRYGPSAFRQTISDGQYDFPRGLSFGGKQHEQATRRFQLYISERLAEAEHVAVIDVHTGLGGFGKDTLQVDGPEARGDLHGLYRRMFPCASIRFAKHRFGTCGGAALLATLRRENRQHHYGSHGLDHPAKKRMRDVFCPSDKTWREKVLARGKAVIAQGLGIAFDKSPASAAADRVTSD